MQAMETTATVDDDHRLTLDRPLPVAGASRVRVIILFDDSDSPDDEMAWRKAAMTSPAFASLVDPGEDVYAPDDGRPYRG